MAVDGPDALYKRYLANDRFMLQRSTSTGRAIYPPRLMVPGDGREDLEWFEPSGRGTIHSFTVVPQRAPKSPYNICLVDLAEGARVLSRVEDAAEDDLSIGAAVVAAIDHAEGAPTLVFRLDRTA